MKSSSKFDFPCARFWVSLAGIVSGSEFAHAASLGFGPLGGSFVFRSGSGVLRGAVHSANLALPYRMPHTTTRVASSYCTSLFTCGTVA